MSKRGQVGRLARLGHALQRRLRHQVGAFRRHEDRQVAVGDLARQPHAAGGDRGAVEFQRCAMQDALQRLAEPGRIRPVIGDAVVLPLVLQRLLPRHDRPDDVDVFPRADHRRAVGLAVPPLHHLRPGGADAAEEPVARKLLQRHRRHRRAGRACAPGICMMPVPALIRVVRASTQAIGVTASLP